MGVAKDKNLKTVQWATLELLPTIAESLASVVTKTTLVFVAFPEEKDRESGLDAYLSGLTGEQQRAIRGVIILRDLGRTEPLYFAQDRDANLATWLQTSSAELKRAPVHGRLFSNQGKKGVPTMWLLSPDAIYVTESSVRMPRSELDFTAYYKTYELLCVFVLELDQRGGDPLPAKKLPVQVP